MDWIILIYWNYLYLKKWGILKFKGKKKSVNNCNTEHFLLMKWSVCTACPGHYRVNTVWVQTQPQLLSTWCELCLCWIIVFIHFISVWTDWTLHTLATRWQTQTESVLQLHGKTLQIHFIKMMRNVHEHWSYPEKIQKFWVLSDRGTLSCRVLHRTFH